MLNKNSLSLPTIVLHWLTGITFIAIFVLGLYMADLPRSPEKGELIGIHKSLGAILLLFAVVRILWRIKEGVLPAAGQVPVWQDKFAKAVHGILMLATLAMPLSGVAMSVGGGRGIDIFGWQIIAGGDKIPWMQEVGGMVHGSAVEIIIAAVLLHIAGAIKHQAVDKDGTISRMLGRAH